MHPLFTLVRPVNAVVSGLSAILGYLIATGTIVPGTALLAVSVFLITGAGNAINDYYDRDIDVINRPDRPLPSGKVTPAQVRYFALLLFVTGIACAVFTTPVCLAIAVINSGLLVAYSASLKKRPFLGNAAVACLAGSIFLYGGAYAGLTGFIANIPIAVITFGAMIARELVKDIEDIPGDQASGADTLAIRFGVRKTMVVALIAAIAAVAFSFVPMSRFGPYYLAGIVPVDCIIIAAVLAGISCTTPGCIKKSRSSLLIKAGMFASLVVFTLSAVFLQ
jgi:geranylgeranylglycerol-phosphate geranylgeranyltransferase